MQVKRSLSKISVASLIFLLAITSAHASQQYFAPDKYSDLPQKRLLSISNDNNRTGGIGSHELSLEKKDVLKNLDQQIAFSVKENHQAKKTKILAVLNKQVAQKQSKKQKSSSFSSVRTIASTSVQKKTTTTQKNKTLTREQRIALEQKRAEEILAAYISKYPILSGVKIYVRDCPYNWQGCAYYTKGIILIDPDHTAPIEAIIAHEVKHIIDWRTDGDIDNNDYHR